MKTKTTKLKPVNDEALDTRLLLTEERFDKKLNETEIKFDLKLENWASEIVKIISDLFNDKIDKIAVSQDKLLKKFENWETENSVGTGQIRELRVDVDGHEKRLKSLESAKN